MNNLEIFYTEIIEEVKKSLLGTTHQLSVEWKSNGVEIEIYDTKTKDGKEIYILQEGVKLYSDCTFEIYQNRFGYILDILAETNLKERIAGAENE